MRGLHALVLAAGTGSRFGGGKLLAPFGGGRLIDGAIRAALAAPVESIIVVVGDEAAAVSAAVRSFPVRIVEASDYAAGLSASLKAGIAALPREATGALVFLGDMPSVPVAVLEPLAEALAAGAPAAIPVFEGRRGNPVALSSRLFREILQLTGDRGARGLVERLGPEVVEVASPDAGVLLDIDTPADLERLR